MSSNSKFTIQNSKSPPSSPKPPWTHPPHRIKLRLYSAHYFFTGKLSPDADRLFYLWPRSLQHPATAIRLDRFFHNPDSTFRVFVVIFDHSYSSIPQPSM